MLSRCDVCIYAGSLVNPELLKLCPPGCELHNSAYMTLEEVMEVIKEAESRNLTTVRLHTGDPSIYGAIKEQMDLLDQAEIEYEVCPGVSSFLAAAAALKLEYTLPNVSQSVVITRIAGRTDVPERESIAHWAAHQATMVIFLSAGHLERLTAELIKGGYQADTPAAIVYKVSWPDEIIVRGTVGQLPEMARKENITKTALVIVGDCLDADDERSKLYSPEFATGYRPAHQKVEDKDRQ